MACNFSQLRRRQSSGSLHKGAQRPTEEEFKDQFYRNVGIYTSLTSIMSSSFIINLAWEFNMTWLKLSFCYFVIKLKWKLCPSLTKICLDWVQDNHHVSFFSGREVGQGPSGNMRAGARGWWRSSRSSRTPRPITRPFMERALSPGNPSEWLSVKSQK